MYLIFYLNALFITLLRVFCYPSGSASQTQLSQIILHNSKKPILATFKKIGIINTQKIENIFHSIPTHSRLIKAVYALMIETKHGEDQLLSHRNPPLITTTIEQHIINSERILLERAKF